MVVIGRHVWLVVFGREKARVVVSSSGWSLEITVDGEARGKPGPASIGAVLLNHKGHTFFSIFIGVKDSYEVKV